MDKETPPPQKQRVIKRTYQVANLILPLDESKKLAQKSGWLAGMLNIAIPIAETLKIAQTTARPWISTVERLRHLYQRKRTQEAALPSLNWEEAVKASGRTPAQLDKRFLTQKRIWRFILFVPALLVLILTALLLINPTPLPLIVWIKASVFSMALLSVSAWGFTQALICEYRRWQLRERRVSHAESGEFRCFLAETSWVKATLKGK